MATDKQIQYLIPLLANKVAENLDQSLNYLTRRQMAEQSIKDVCSKIDIEAVSVLIEWAKEDKDMAYKQFTHLRDN